MSINENKTFVIYQYFKYFEMNLKFGTIISIILSFISLFIEAYKNEKGDMNSILMYPIVYFFPILILSWMNSFLIFMTFYKPKLKSKIFFLIFLFPIVVYCATNPNIFESFKFIIFPMLISSLTISLLDIKNIKLSE